MFLGERDDANVDIRSFPTLINIFCTCFCLNFTFTLDAPRLVFAKSGPWRLPTYIFNQKDPTELASNKKEVQKVINKNQGVKIGHAVGIN
uniref:COesterase domain-containing protein n=1 Tax=Panagrellus redivivus TaxID=6233 RepID=A0A7E4VUU5_PANRE